MSESSQLALSEPKPLFGLSTLEEAINFSSQMAKANLLPAHLKGSPADCLRVVMQAARWQMDPFAVADKTSVIGGKLMHEGQLVSAVINSRGGLTKRLTYNFEGEGENRVLTVSGQLKGENEPRTIELTVQLAKKINKNGQMGINPDQQMTYIGARLWARRHTPELMMGVYTPDEVTEDEPQNVTGTAEDEPKVERPKVERSKKGAAKAMENPEKPADAAIDITSSKAEEKPVTPPAEQKAPEKVADPVAEKKADVPKPTTDRRTSLAAGEILTFEGLEIVEFRADMFGKIPGIKAEVRGLFTGVVYDTTGVKMKDPTDAAKGFEFSAAWQIKKPITITLLGKPRKDGSVASMVQSIAISEGADSEVP